MKWTKRAGHGRLTPQGVWRDRIAFLAWRMADPIMVLGMNAVATFWIKGCCSLVALSVFPVLLLPIHTVHCLSRNT